MTNLLNPLTILACKQKVGAEEAASIELPLLVHLDCARRGQCTNAGVNFLTTHLIAASYVAARTKSKRFHDQVTKAYAQLKKASDRPTVLLDLTTGEYRAVREAIATYLRAMPNVEVGTMAEAWAAAERSMA